MERFIVVHFFKHDGNTGVRVNSIEAESELSAWATWIKYADAHPEIVRRDNARINLWGDQPYVALVQEKDGVSATYVPELFASMYRTSTIGRDLVRVFFMEQTGDRLITDPMLFEEISLGSREVLA